MPPVTGSRDGGISNFTGPQIMSPTANGMILQVLAHGSGTRRHSAVYSIFPSPFSIGSLTKSSTVEKPLALSRISGMPTSVPFGARIDIVSIVLLAGLIWASAASTFISIPSRSVRNKTTASIKHNLNKPNICATNFLRYSKATCAMRLGLTATSPSFPSFLTARTPAEVALTIYALLPFAAFKSTTWFSS